MNPESIHQAPYQCCHSYQLLEILLTLEMETMVPSENNLGLHFL